MHDRNDSSSSGSLFQVCGAIPYLCSLRDKKHTIGAIRFDATIETVRLALQLAMLTPLMAGLLALWVMRFDGAHISLIPEAGGQSTKRTGRWR